MSVNALRMPGDSADPLPRWPVAVCLGLISIFPLFSVPVQGATGALATRVGEIGARTLTEGAIWAYAALVVGVATFAERRSLASIGLRRPTLGGVLWGVCAAVTLLALGGLVSFVTYDLLHQPNRSPAAIEALVRGSLGYALMIALRGGVVEEILYRGLAVEQLSRVTGRRGVAGLIVTVVFILAHALRFDARQIVPISTIAFGFMGLYLWRGNLWINIVAHVLIDAVALGVVAVHATSLY